VGYDARTNTWPPTAGAQAATALDIIEQALREAGATLGDLVRVRVYVPERADVEAGSGVIKRRLGAARAANTTVCTPLAVENARVEIEVTALKPPGRRPAARHSRARRRPR
jgi:enamine deaminase RidA (YjgF/YER057c/UK114 family)